MATLDDLLAELKAIRTASTGGRTGPTLGGPRSTPSGLTPAQLQEYEETLDRIDVLMAKNTEYAKQHVELEKEKQKRTKKRKELEEAIAAGDSARQARAEQDLINIERQIEKQEELVERLRDAEQAAEDLGNSFGSIFSGKAPDLKGMLDPKNIQGLAKNFGKVKDAQMLSQMASKAAVAALFEYTKAIVELAMELDESEVAFMKATGANRDFARSITNSFQETRKFGASAKETAEAAQELFGSFTDFTMVSEDVRENLIQTSTALARAGVSNQDFAKSIQTSTKALGMSADQAAQNMLNLEKFAENLGVAPQRLAADFANAGDMVAKLGQNGTKAFKDLQVVMKVTGMSMDSILSITNKFDTFEGAAEMAGQLNAAIGGNFVNAMDLMMATNPAERFEMIRGAIMDTGLSFDEMSYYQKQFYADSMGLKDVGELALMMSGNIDLMDGAVQQSQQSYEDAAKRAQRLQSVQEKLQTAFAQLVPAIIPLIDAFSEMAGFVSENIAVIKPLLGVLAIAFGIITGPTGVGGVAGLTLGISLLFDSFEMGTDKATGLSSVFRILYNIGVRLYDNVAGLFKVFGFFFSLLPGVTEETNGFLLVIEGLGRALIFVLEIIEALVMTLGALNDFGFGLLKGDINEATSAFDGLGDKLFRESFASSFLEGLVKIGKAMVDIAKSAKEILNPFNAVEGAVTAVGETFTAILGGIDSFFTTIADPEAAENVAKIARAISEVKPIPAASYTAAMTATAAAQTAGAVGAAVEGATEMVSNFMFGSSDKSDKKQEITVNLMLDRQKLATVVREINGKAAVDAIAERS